MMVELLGLLGKHGESPVHRILRFIRTIRDFRLICVKWGLKFLVSGGAGYQPVIGILRRPAPVPDGPTRTRKLVCVTYWLPCNCPCVFALHDRYLNHLFTESVSLMSLAQQSFNRLNFSPTVCFSGYQRSHASPSRASMSVLATKWAH